MQDLVSIPQTMTRSAYVNIQIVMLWPITLGAPKAKALLNLTLGRVSLGCGK